MLRVIEEWIPISFPSTMPGGGCSMSSPFLLTGKLHLLGLKFIP